MCNEILVTPHCACHQNRISLFFVDCHTAGCKQMLCLIFGNYQVLIHKAELYASTEEA